MALSWPGTLPTKPQMDGWQELPGDTSLTSQMGVGPPKKRNRSTMPLDEYKVTYKLTTAQRATLVTFFQTTTASGVTEFEWTHPILSTILTVQFTQSPQFVAHGIDWLCSFALRETS